jgi:hypothetical protein
LGRRSAPRAEARSSSSSGKIVGVSGGSSNSSVAARIVEGGLLGSRFVVPVARISE